ncbi:MAG: helix-turn-helix transcriptional regulator [Nitrospinaceae bacterium]|jgi:transcriptional regulator with XRE-family HTH domain|nr:helix-turn-helix transcriptional regulator [Nitrospina sp.]MBT5376532.1 helix-turn-helix transcriptional regulator [Nitrospinaceae bacterium]MBT5867532.1 helix-turn-helix transcriptional regulator [Nitrospinaceae bacterium]MBT6346629.1 helix-turn-helix transcriptional regulator [Nitrospina sp.]
MTILSENLRTLRKKLNCTQMTLSEVLEIGFRTYVRYEAGERDAPVSVLVKLAALGKVSLDRLLTTEIHIDDLDTPDQKISKSTIQNAKVIGGGIEEGRLMFKGLLSDHLVTNTQDEQKLLTLFRESNPTNRDKFLQDLEWMFNNTRRSHSTDTQKIPRKLEKAQTAVKLNKLAKNIPKITVRG